MFVPQQISHAALAIFLLLCTPAIAASSDDKKSKAKPTLPCTLHSPNTGSFFDVRPISLHPLKEGEKPHKDQRTQSWHARGWDYPANFTLNICAPVLEPIKSVVGVKDSLWQNVSAYYELHGKTYSIGYSLGLRLESTEQRS